MTLSGSVSPVTRYLEIVESVCCVTARAQGGKRNRFINLILNQPNISNMSNLNPLYTYYTRPLRAPIEKSERDLSKMYNVGLQHLGTAVVDPNGKNTNT